MERERCRIHTSCFLLTYKEHSAGIKESFTSYFKHFCSICSHIEEYENFILKYNFENTKCCLAIYLKMVKCTLCNLIKDEEQIILLIKGVFFTLQQREAYSHYNKGKHIYSATKVKPREVNLEIKKIKLIYKKLS